MSRITPDSLHLLIADDDAVFSAMLREYLESERCIVELAHDGRQAMELLDGRTFDLLILDIMMPELTGIDVLKRLRPNNPIPVIMLTAKGDDLDRILGLELGADDYLAKPCNPRELLARIHAVMRRAIPMDIESQRPIRIDDIHIQPDNREVRIERDPESSEYRKVSLTQTEFDLLYLLLSHPHKLIRKSEISQKILGKPLSRWDRSIDVHISNLRRKLGKDGQERERIKTLRGSGYIYHPSRNM